MGKVAFPLRGESVDYVYIHSQNVFKRLIVCIVLTKILGRDNTFELNSSFLRAGEE